jgi:hypothetical protein
MIPVLQLPPGARLFIRAEKNHSNIKFPTALLPASTGNKAVQIFSSLLDITKADNTIACTVIDKLSEDRR